MCLSSPNASAHVALSAKNVILAGVRTVTLHDTANVALGDLSAHFYLSEADVGKNRAESCKEKLQELNTAVAVVASMAPLNEALLKQFQVGMYRNPRLILQLSSDSPIPKTHKTIVLCAQPLQCHGTGSNMSATQLSKQPFAYFAAAS